MPNPSELQRISEEQLASAVRRVNNLQLSKSSREAALREVRALEKELGVDALGNYNQSAQQQQDAALVGSVVTMADLKAARSRIETLTPGEIGTIIIALSGEPVGAAGRALINKLLNR